MSATTRQLSLEVEPEPELGADDRVIGSLTVAGTFAVGRDLQRGDKLIVTVAGADGELLTTSEAVVGKVGFSTLRAKGEPIGTERKHGAKLVA